MPTDPKKTLVGRLNASDRLPPPDATAPLPRAHATRDPTDRERADALATLRNFQPAERQDSRSWARRLRYRELCGERLTNYQRNAWREALGEGAPSSPSEGDAPYESTT